MDMKTLQFVSGFVLLAVGIRWWSYDHTQYILGIGFIAWGTASILLAWLGKNGGGGRSRNEQLAGILYLAGTALVVIGLFMRN